MGVLVLYRRLLRLRYRGFIGGNAIMVIIAGAVLLVVCGGVALGVNQVSHAAMPDYAQQAAQNVGQNVQAQIAAAVEYDPTIAAQVDAAGVKTWTSTVNVKGVAKTATITTTPSGNVLLIDVAVGNATYRTFAPLSASSIAPGTVVHGG